MYLNGEVVTTSNKAAINSLTPVRAETGHDEHWPLFSASDVNTFDQIRYFRCISCPNYFISFVTAVLPREKNGECLCVTFDNHVQDHLTFPWMCGKWPDSSMVDQLFAV